MNAAPATSSPGTPRAHAAEVNRELGGVRARNQVRGADEIEEGLAA